MKNRWLISLKYPNLLILGRFEQKLLRRSAHSLLSRRSEIHERVEQLMYENDTKLKFSFIFRDRCAGGGWLRVWSLFDFVEYCRFWSLFDKNLPKSWKMNVFHRKNDNFPNFLESSAPKIGHFSILVTPLFGGHPFQIDLWLFSLVTSSFVRNHFKDVWSISTSLFDWNRKHYLTKHWWTHAYFSLR